MEYKSYQLYTVIKKGGKVLFSIQIYAQYLCFPELMIVESTQRMKLYNI